MSEEIKKSDESHIEAAERIIVKFNFTAETALFLRTCANKADDAWNIAPAACCYCKAPLSFRGDCFPWELSCYPPCGK